MKNNLIISIKVLFFFLLIVAAPIIVIIGAAFHTKNFITNESNWSFNGLNSLITATSIKELSTILIRSIFICFTATIISYIISHVLVFNLTKRVKYIFLIIITLPFLINESVRIFSWQYLLSENGFLNNFLSKISHSKVLIFNGSNIYNVFFVMTLACIPFGIFINTYSLETIPSIYWKVASDLKLNKVNQFIKVELPLSIVPIITTTVILFFIAFSLSTEVNFLGGDTKVSTRNLILSFMSASKFQAVFTLGMFIIIIILFFTSAYTYFSDRKHENN